MEKILFNESDRILNISEMETSEAIESAKLCKTVRIRVRNLTPRGRVSIPVRIEKQKRDPLDIIEEIALCGIATPEQFEKIEKIYNIMTDNIHIFTRGEIESMKQNFIQ